MAVRFTYSRWDGTQKGFDLDADQIMDEITDDLLYHGDVNAALRRMLQNGFRDADGNRMQGLREMLQQLRDRRQELKDSGNLGGVYDEIAQELTDILDEERHGIDRQQAQADSAGDERRQDLARQAASERHLQLDMLPEDLAGRVRELQNYDFTSAEAQQRFEQLMDKLREQLMQQYVDQMTDGVQNASPEQM